MKVGGNESARSHFGTTLKYDIQSKYNSKTAQKYKEKLVSKVLEDEKNNSDLLASLAETPVPISSSTHFISQQSKQQPKLGIGKLGAKKTEIDFDLLEQEAKQQADQRTATEARAKEEAKVALLSKSKDDAQIDDYKEEPIDDTQNITKEEQAAMERLGMGFHRIKLQQQRSKPKQNSHLDNKFDQSKGISSEQYFGKDNEMNEEDRRRLNAEFGNATSISSDVFFRRDVNERLSDDSSPIELARRLYQSADMNTIRDLIQSGSSRLGSALQDLQNKYGGRS